MRFIVYYTFVITVWAPLTGNNTHASHNGVNIRPHLFNDVFKNKIFPTTSDVRPFGFENRKMFEISVLKGLFLALHSTVDVECRRVGVF